MQYTQPRRKYPEIELYRQVAHYLNTKHPKVIYHFDLSGVHNPSRTTRGIYKSLNGSGFPDLFIAKPVFAAKTVDTYSGLFLELKADGTRVRKRDGSFASEHLTEQAATLDALERAGFAAKFAVGFDAAVELIDTYMRGEL